MRGDTLRLVRYWRNVGQDVVASRSYVSQSRISQVENAGRSWYPERRDTTADLAELLRVEPALLSISPQDAFNVLAREDGLWPALRNSYWLSYIEGFIREYQRASLKADEAITRAGDRLAEALATMRHLQTQLEAAQADIGSARNAISTVPIPERLRTALAI